MTRCFVGLALLVVLALGAAVAAAPAPTLALAAGQKSPTNLEPLLFSVTFSEPVVGFSSAGVDVSPPAAVSVREVAPDDGTTFEIAVSSVAEDGTVRVSIPAGAAVGELDGAPSAASLADASIVLDRTPPPAPPLVEPADGAATSDLSPRFAWTPPDDLAGAAKYEIEIRGPKVRDYVTTRTTYAPSLDVEGNYTWRVNCLDRAGNLGPWTEWRALTLDATPPAAPLLVSASPTEEWSRDVALRVDLAPATDAGSGLSGYAALWDRAAASSPGGISNRPFEWTGEAFAVPSDGVWWFHVTALDRAGNSSDAVHVGPFRIDATPPELRGVVGSLRLPNDPGTLSATADWSGVTAVDALDPSPTLSFSIASGARLPMGASSVVATAFDRAGNAASFTFTVLVYNTEPPTVQIRSPGARARLAVGDELAPSWDVASLAPIAAVRTDGLVNGLLDTRTPGRHEFRVTVEDSTGLFGTATGEYCVSYAELGVEIARVRPDGAAEALFSLPASASLEGADAESQAATLRLSEWLRVECAVDPSLAAYPPAPASYSLVRADPDDPETPILERWGTLAWDGSTYTLALPLVVFRPGAYTLWLGFADGTSVGFAFRLVR